MSITISFIFIVAFENVNLCYPCLIHKDYFTLFVLFNDRSIPLLVFIYGLSIELYSSIFHVNILFEFYFENFLENIFLENPILLIQIFSCDRSENNISDFFYFIFLAFLRIICAIYDRINHIIVQCILYKLI